MEQKVQNFVNAVKNDEHYEFFLSENKDLLVHIDIEGDYRFLPVVLDLDRNYSEQEIDDKLCEQLDDVFTFETLHFEEGMNYDLYYPEHIEFTSEELEDSEAWC